MIYIRSPMWLFYLRWKRDYLRVHISKIRYMQNETKILKFIFCQFTHGGRISHHPLRNWLSCYTKVGKQAIMQTLAKYIQSLRKLWLYETQNENLIEKLGCNILNKTFVTIYNCWFRNRVPHRKNFSNILYRFYCTVFLWAAYTFLNPNSILIHWWPSQRWYNLDLWLGSKSLHNF